jgi:hypothetical protein
MTLMRPEASLRVEGSLELSLEQRILGELSDIKESQTFMRVMLLGGIYREVPHDGKLPVLDRTILLTGTHIELCEKRIKLLEDDKIERDSAMRTTKWICGLVGTFGGALATFLVNLLMKH